MNENDEFDLQAVVDGGAWGPEPAKDYLKSLDMLDNVVRECIFVSRRYAGIEAPEGRHFYASVLFVALITRGVSLLNLAPYSPWAAKKIEHWDYASMTGVVRTMIELRAAFHYLCADPCSQDEWYCRWNLFNLHDCVSRIRLFTAQKNDQQVVELEVQAEELRERLRTNSFFQALDPKQHKKLLHGQTAYLFPLETLMEKAGMEVETFRMLYILFSTHVHALPMSFYRLSGDNPERGRGLPSSAEEGYSSLCLTLAATLIVASREEMHALFDGLEQNPAYVAMHQAERMGGETEAETDDGDAEAGADLTIGESASVDVSEYIRITYTRLAIDEIAVVYVHRPSGETVFEGVTSEMGGLQFESFDPYYWDVSVDGAPTTLAAFERMIAAEFLMRVDVKGRRILFKTRATGEAEPAAEEGRAVNDQGAQ
ncbi:DUF5677 domain-containing protein [Novosphingobium sp.]|mgnify:CR=1 FL=1|uniref:DUF5677 domain-containing protein n=1 Tax=Novosphingobium sp. TaxID=1874826 RepID=UPI002FDDDCFE